MLGIWFNHDDLLVRKNQEDFECLKLFGFTDAFILFKGCVSDMRDKTENHKYLDFVINGVRKNGVRVHGVFFCSEDKKYITLNPDRADMRVFGKTETFRIRHLDKKYIEYLNSSIVSANEEYSLDGIQLDFVRYGTVLCGWSPEEENIYRTFGVNVSKLKKEILATYDLSKPNYNLNQIFQRYLNNDEQLIAFVAGRRSIIKNFVHMVTDNIRLGVKDVDLSVAMMPEGMYEPWRAAAALHYGQDFEDFAPYFDYMIPMVYAGVFNQTSEWISKVAGNVCERFPQSVIGLDCIGPRINEDVRADIEALKNLKNAGICYFRYGRMILALRDGNDTILYNTYPGTVTKLILINDGEEIVRDCTLHEASWMRLKGHWNRIRAFGSFSAGKPQNYEGEMCVLEKEILR